MEYFSFFSPELSKTLSRIPLQESSSSAISEQQARSRNNSVQHTPINDEETMLGRLTPQLTKTLSCFLLQQTENSEEGAKAASSHNSKGASDPPSKKETDLMRASQTSEMGFLCCTPPQLTKTLSCFLIEPEEKAAECKAAPPQKTLLEHVAGASDAPAATIITQENSFPNAQTETVDSPSKTNEPHDEVLSRRKRESLLDLSFKIKAYNKVPGETDTLPSSLKRPEKPQTEKRNKDVPIDRTVSFTLVPTFQEPVTAPENSQSAMEFEEFTPWDQQADHAIIALQDDDKLFLSENVLKATFLLWKREGKNVKQAFLDKTRAGLSKGGMERHNNFQKSRGAMMFAKQSSFAERTRQKSANMFNLVKQNSFTRGRGNHRAESKTNADFKNHTASLSEFERACQSLADGPIDWLPLDDDDKKWLESTFGSDSTTGLNLQALFDFIDASKDNSPGFGVEPMPDQLCHRALNFLTYHNPIRQFFLKVAFNTVYQRIILFFVIMNAITLTLTEYSVVDSTGQPTSKGSVRNAIVASTDPLFTAVFCLECILKVGALGFAFGEFTYLRSGWNCFDFLVVITSLVTYLPEGKKARVLKVFRVLRPLKAIGRFDGLRSLVDSLAGTLGPLGNAGIIAVFVLYVYTSIGLEVYAGAFHSRCRMTPFPVKLDKSCSSVVDPCWSNYLQNVTTNPDWWRCVDAPNDDPSWMKDSSPWHSRQDCIWPFVNEAMPRLCTLSGTGLYKCSQNFTCGSEYDAFGNARFISSPIPFGIDRMKASVYFTDFNWGITTFDNFGLSFLTLFQLLTMTDWYEMMEMGMDTVSFEGSAFFFILASFTGAFVLINMVVGVMANGLEVTRENLRKKRLEAGKEASTRAASIASVPSILSPDDEFTSGKSCCECCLTEVVRKVVDSTYFSRAMMMFILANTIVLALDHYPEEDSFYGKLSVINDFLTGIFALEMLLIIWCHGFYNYVSQLSSLFDGVIVVSSFTELILTRFLQHGSKAVSALRAFRMFRLFRLVRKWEDLNLLLTAMISSFLQVGNFGVVLAMFIYIFALIGMELFANQLHFDPVTSQPLKFGDAGYDNAFIPRFNFDTFGYAVLTVYAALTFENWDQMYYSCFFAVGPTASVYFVILMIFGAFIIMNLFLAILILNFARNDHIMAMDHSFFLARTGRGLFKTFEGSKALGKQLSFSKRSDQNFRGSIYRHFCMFHAWLSKIVKDQRFERIVLLGVCISSATLCFESPLLDPNGSVMRNLTLSDWFFSSLFLLEAGMKLVVYGVKYQDGYFSDPWNCLDFTVSVLSMIAQFNIGASPSLRAVRLVRVFRPLRLVKRIPGLKQVVTVIMKSIPTMINIAVISLLIFFIFAIFAVSVLKGTFYKCGAAMTPNQAELVLHPLPWNAMTSDQQLMFNSSTCSTFETFPAKPTSKDICNCLFDGNWGRVLPFPLGFDNSLSGLFTFYEISTTSAWEDVMWAAVDNRGIDAQPNRDSNVTWIPFFVLFILIGYVFLYNVFIGAIVDFFNRTKRAEGTLFATQAQQDWIYLQAIAKKMRSLRKFRKPKGSYRLLCFNVVTDTRFEVFNSILIALNALIMAMGFFGAPEVYDTAINNINTAFSLYFNGEALLKILAFGTSYFNDGWNNFDFLIVIGIDATLIVGWVSGTYVGSLTSVGRIGRILRLVRLFRLTTGLRGVNKLLEAMTASLLGFLNVALLILLVLVIYAIAGVQLFGLVGNTQDTVTDTMNFRTLGNALIVLFRMATLDNWNYFAHSLAYRNPGCEDNPSYNPNWCEVNNNNPGCVHLNGCGTIAVLPYMYSFVLVTSISLMNLFIGVILDSIKGHDKDEMSHVTEEVIQDYNNVWDLVDPYRTNLLPESALPDFIGLLKPPFGLADKDRNNEEACEAFAKQLAVAHVLKGKQRLPYLKYKAVTLALTRELLTKMHSDFNSENCQEQKGIKSHLKSKWKEGSQAVFRYRSKLSLS